MSQLGDPFEQANAVGVQTPTEPPPTSAPTPATVGASLPVRAYELDGVRCYWAESDGPLTAGLVFGVGMSDEGFAERGLTHLIEHMTLHGIDRGISYNGAVDLTTTTLHCTGPLSDVQQFFAAAIHGLNNLPFHELEREARVLAAESARQPVGYGAEALSIVYGFMGPGRVALPEAGLWGATPERVEAWKRHFFVRENAAAFFHGPMPQGISFAEVPVGQRPAHEPPTRFSAPKPMLHRAHCLGPTVFAPVDRGATTGIIAGIAQERLTNRLRGELGVSYNVAAQLTEISADKFWLAISADAANAEHGKQVLETMQLELARLASDGPTTEELQFVVSQMDKSQRGERGDITLAEAATRARYFATGRPYREYDEIRAALGAMGHTEFSEPLAQALQAPLWVVPHNQPVDDRRMEDVPSWSAQKAEGASFPSKYHDTTLQISDSMLSICMPNGDAVTAELAKTVGAATYTDGGAAFFTDEGFVVRLVGSDYDAQPQLDDFLRRLPAAQVVASSDPLRSSEAAAALVPKAPTPPADQEASNESAGQRSASLLDRFKKRRSSDAAGEGEQFQAQPQSEQPVGMPGYEITLGHPGAIQMAEAVVAGDWAQVDSVFARAASADDQSHMIWVASETGGTPDRFNAWVNGANKPGLALVLRGIAGLNWAWAARSASQAEHVTQEMFREFWNRLRNADADLLQATNELPDSPLPWEGLLITARGLQIPREEAEDRYVAHVERGATLSGHLAFQQLLCAKWSGSHDEMWEHADYICSQAADGAPELALSASAFVEHWLAEFAADFSRFETASHLIDAIGRKSFVADAASRALSSPDFQVPTPAGARALNYFFFHHVLMAEWSAAASLLPAIGEREQAWPRSYFTQASWTELRDDVLRNAGR